MTDQHPLTDNTRDLIRRLADALDLLASQPGRRYAVIGTSDAYLINEARAYLAQSEPEGPSESDVTELFYRYVGEGSEVGFENAIEEALARWGRPKPPSLKELALEALDEAIFMADDDPPEGICSDQADTIRRALEALPDD